MQPSEKRPGQQSVRRKVRRILHGRLGWLRGAPAGPPSGGRLPWRVAPRAGAHGGEELELTGEFLGSSVTAAHKLIREFPRVLPQVVGDMRDWKAAVDHQVRRVRRVLEGELGWDELADELIDHGHSRREGEQVRQLRRSHPELAVILHGWCWRLDPELEKELQD